MAELASAGATLVLSSHEIERVERFCEYVALIDRGRLRFDGTSRELRDRHPQLRALRLELAAAHPALTERLPQLREVPHDGDGVALEIAATQIDREALLRTALDAGARVTGLQTIEPSMRELFVREVEAS